MQDRHACFQIGRLNVGDQPHGETRDQAFLQPLNLAGGPVAGDHDLAARFMQGVEGVEELLLGVFLALDELDVIHHDQIRGAVAIAEGLHAVFANRQDQVIGECLG